MGKQKKQSKRYVRAKQPDSKRVTVNDYHISNKRLIKRILHKFKQDRSLLVRMKLRNGFFESFIVYTKGETFIYKGGEYVLDQEAMYPDLPSGLRFSFYHEDCAVPFTVDFDVNELAEKLTKDEHGQQLIQSINPRTLRRIITAKLTQQLAQGNDLVDMMRRVMMLIFIMLGVIAFNIILTLRLMGVW